MEIRITGLGFCSKKLCPAEGRSESQFEVLQQRTAVLGFCSKELGPAGGSCKSQFEYLQQCPGPAEGLNEVPEAGTYTPYPASLPMETCEPGWPSGCIGGRPPKHPINLCLLLCCARLHHPASIMAQWVEIEWVEWRGAWWTHWFGAWWQWGHFGDTWQKTREVEMADEDHHCASHSWKPKICQAACLQDPPEEQSLIGQILHDAELDRQA